MTDIIEDNVNINLQIGTTSDDEPIMWDLIDAEVVLSQVATPNYVDMVVAPQPQYLEDIDEQLPDLRRRGTGGNAISAIVGSVFRFEVDNDLVAVRNDLAEQTDVSDIEEDSLLFQGRLANISPMGNGLYEAIAYDPGQQAFNIGAESGSIINQKLDFTGSSTNPDFVEPEDFQDNDVEGSNSRQATRLLELIVNEVGITDFEIELTDEGVTAEGEPAGDAPPEETFATTQELSDGPFKSGVVPVKDALDYAREQCSAEWWFDKSGTFHFGKPNSRNYEMSLIKDTSAGITTPPYQSVEVVGSSTATSDGWNSTNQVQDDDKKIVKRAIIARPSAGGTQANKIIILDPTNEQFEQFKPPFKYVNVELSTDEQVQNAAIKVADELAKQQATGTITTVGFPEVVPFDGLVMPNSDSQPMGGQTYGVYKVTHRLNADNGFTTKIQVAGPTNILQSVDVQRDEEEGEEGETQFTGDRIATSTDREVYTNDGERRAFKPGAGEGD
jgi:hypothetical protein